MSGIEAIGLILGLWPIVVNLSNAYKAGKDGSSITALTMNIAVYEKIFRQSIQKLLQGDEELSPKDRHGLISGDKEFAALWVDPEFVGRLEKRLDKDTFAILEYKTKQISKILENLKKKIVADSEKKGTRMKSIKLAMQTTDVKKHLGELKDHVDGLRTVLESSSTSTIYSGKATPSPTPTRPTHQRTTSGEQRKQYFNDFYQTLCQSFNCHCGRPHEASLRISDTLELVFPVDEASRTMSSELTMRARSLTLGSVATTFQSEADVENTESDILRTTWSRSGRPSVSSRSLEHRALLVVFNESRGVRNLAPIGDLCQWLRTHRESPPGSLEEGSQGVLGPDGKRYTVASRVHDNLNAPTVTSMDDCLSSGDGGGLTRRTRLDLALHLASAIERFHPTFWIDIAWTWRNFSMMTEDRSHRLCITRRFWSLDSRHPSLINPPTSKFWRNLRHKDPMLVRLGFALIELAMGKRLSDIRASMNKDGDTVEQETEWMKDLEDWNTANDLVDANIIQDEVSSTYQQIVATCLQCEVLEDCGIKQLRSDSKTFEDDIEKFVVRPLRQYHANTWGIVGQIASF